MRAPSFRCTDAEKGNGLILHYYSEREGLQDIVIGIIKTVAQQIHGTEIEMKVSGPNWHRRIPAGLTDSRLSSCVCPPVRPAFFALLPPPQTHRPTALSQTVRRKWQMRLRMRCPIFWKY